MIESFARHLRSITVIAACAAGLSAVAWAARPESPAPVPAPAPVSIALVDFGRIIDALTEYKDRTDQVATRGKVLEDNLKALKTQREEKNAQIKMVPKDDIKRGQALIFERLELDSQIEARTKLYQRKIDLDHGDVIRDIYNKVIHTAEALAKKEGYDMVMMDDRSMTMPLSGTPDTYGQIIQTRRILYAKDALDLTDRVLTIMNTDYTSGAKPNP